MFNSLYCRSEERTSRSNESKVLGKPHRIKTKRPLNLAIRWSVVTFEKWKLIFLKLFSLSCVVVRNVSGEVGMSTLVSVPCVKNMRKELGRGLSNRLKFIDNP